MTIDVATLVFDFKSDTAVTAEQRMDNLIAKGERLEAVSRRVRKATDMVGDGHRTATSAADRAAQANMALAQSEGAVEKAARAAAKEQAQAEREATSAARARTAEVRAQRQLEAAAMRELVAATKAYERDQAAAARAAAQAAREQAQAVASLEARIHAFKSAVDPTYAAQARLNAEMAEARELYRIGAVSASDYAKRVGQLDEQMAAAARGQVMLNGVMVGAGRQTKHMQMAVLDLSRQFADIGVTAAMGMSPLMILIQQGPQIIDRLALMKAEGIGLSAALRAMGASLLPMLPILAAIAAVVGTVAAGFGLLHRELSKGYPKDITDGLGLTEEQLDRVKSKTVTFGDTVAATFTVIGRHIMDGPVGEALRWLGEFFSDVMDKIVEGALSAMADFVSFWTAAYKTIVEHWRQFPLAFSAIVVGAVNIAIGQLEGLINTAIGGLNRLTEAANKIPGVNLGRIEDVSLPRIAQASNPVAADFERYRTDAREAFMQSAGALGQEIRDEALARPRRRATEEAGKANKGSSSTPRDVTDERSAQLARMIAQAQQEELQARLALATDINERARLERAILDAGHAEKIAELDGQIARIKDDKKNAEAAQQIAQLEELKLTQARIADLGKELIERRRAADLARQAHDIRMGELDIQRDVLESQAGLLKSAFAQSVLEQQILAVRQEQERLDLEEVVRRGVIGGYSEQEVELAKRRLGVLEEIHANEQEQARQQSRLVDAISEAADAAGGLRNALNSHDWGRAFDEFARVIETVKASFASQGMRGGMMTLGSAVAQTVGGKTGAAIGGGLSIAGGMAGLGGMLSGGGIAAGLANGIVGLGGSAALAGGIGSAIMSIGSMLGPIGLAVGALSAAAKLLNVGGKPTNAGAGYDLITGQLSGNKRTSETEAAVTGAAQAIKDIEETLKAAGIGLTDSVRGLVIGTRDASTIYLTSGKELKSAVGDVGAAVETALRAMLESATFASEGQERVAKAAMAAGGGLEAVAQALDAYAAAQQISANLADEILRLTDPKAYDLQAVTRAIEEQRKAYEALTKDGYLTADQLATINDQLSKLEGLQLDEVLKRFGEAVNDNARAAEEAAKAQLDAAKAFTDRIFEVSRGNMGLQADLLAAQGDMAGSTALRRQLQLEGMDPMLRAMQQAVWQQEDVNAARDALTQAVERERSSIESARDKFQGFSDSLADFAADLSRSAAEALGPGASYRHALSQWSKVLSRGVTDQASLQAFLGAGNAFASASQGSQSQIQYLRDLAAVRMATENAQRYADTQVDIATQQLKALDATVNGLLGVQQGVLSVEQAIHALALAMAAQKAGGAGGAGAVAQAALTGMLSGAGGWYTQSPGGGWGGLLPGFDTLGGGYTLPNGLNSASYYGSGGMNPLGFATGGSFDIGGSSPTGDQLIVPIRGNSGEHVNVSKQDSMARLADAMERQNALLERLAKSSDENARAAKDTANTLNNAARGNQPLKTAAA